ncbi:unnamed protein product [Lupinus luteus]|uniref:Uncharacterized protein n=1 Tax=Lupinus luteus TaxID=3873 RepID=A0AAV1WFN2_LUPLU
MVKAVTQRITSRFILPPNSIWMPKVLLRDHLFGDLRSKARMSCSTYHGWTALLLSFWSAIVFHMSIMNNGVSCDFMLQNREFRVWECTPCGLEPSLLTLCCNGRQVWDRGH